LITIFLLVTAASLVSYLLSQWSFIRNGDKTIGWLAIGISTLLLMAAAAMVVLTTSWLPTLHLWPNDEKAERTRKSAQFGPGIAESVLHPLEASTEAPSAKIGPAVSEDRGVSPTAGRYATAGDSGRRTGSEAVSAPNSLQSSQAHWEAESGVGRVSAAVDPWAATNCVYAFNLDPADLTRWTIENECGVPVGIVFASCSASAPECNGRQSRSWEYQSDGMVLPGKAQRPVFYQEQTQYGRVIRYVACVVATPLAVKLIGQSSETRSSQSWAAQFDAARSSDECLTRVQQWSNAGLRSGNSIDVLLGQNLPGKVRPTFTSEP
jgi:hypothetical protein